MEELWIDYVNSEWHDWRGSGASEDRLEKEGWLGEWLQQRSLPPIGRPSPGQLAVLKAFRTELRAWAERLALGGKLTDQDLERLNHRLLQAPLIKKIERTENGELQLIEVPGTDLHEADSLLSAVAHSFATTVASPLGSRVRICDNRDCLWVFYDDTRNRSKRYCDDSMCGNLMKVRRFRERKKQANADDNRE